MAAPKDAPEQAFRLRKFQGTATEPDSTFLGASFLSRSQNWIPTQSYRLGKRPGSRLLADVGLGTVRITDLLPAYSIGENFYLYAYCQTASGAQVNQSAAEGAFAATPGVTFASATAFGRLITFRDRVYAGNGVDPLKSWVIGDTDPSHVQTYAAMALDAPATAPDTAIAAAAAGSDEVPTGTYSYAWGRFDKNSGLYVGRTAAEQVIIPVQSTITFTAPPGALGPNQVYRLFVSPRNYPIEYATMQADSVTTGATTAKFSSFDVSDTRCPVSAGVARTGNMFVIWRNRVVFAGSATDPYSVYATDVILPGLEQATFNQGTFFPVNAKVPLPRKVTGVGIAGVTSDQEAQSPLLFFTASQTFLCTGDPFDPLDTTATLVELSSRVGCIGHDSIVNTPYGTLFCGIDSVYMIPPGGGYPQDLGWPIADQIRQIPPGVRATISAVFHKQFYKLAIPGASGTTNTQQWWLDLRQGVQASPSWWGPHSIGITSLGDAPLALSTLAADPSSLAEVDRGYAAIAESDHVVLHHQLDRFTDYYPGKTNGAGVASILQSGRFDGDMPFTAKVITRLRVIAQTAAKSPLGCTLMLDNGQATKIDDIMLGEDMDPAGQFVHLTPFGDPPFPPANQCWNTAKFGSISPAEAQTITPYARPRCLSVSVVLTHAPRPEDDPTTNTVPAVELRDFELLYIPSERKVRYTGVAGRFRQERVSV